MNYKMEFGKCQQEKQLIKTTRKLK